VKEIDCDIGIEIDTREEMNQGGGKECFMLKRAIMKNELFFVVCLFVAITSYQMAKSNSS